MHDISILMASTIETVFQVQGLDCEDEVVAVRRVLLSLAGVLSVDSNLIDSQIRITHEETILTSLLIQKIESVGLKIKNSEQKNQDAFNISKGAFLILISGGFLALGLMISWFSAENNFFAKIFYFITIATGSILIFPKAVRSVKIASLDMNVLMMIATIGAIVIGEYAEAAAVVFLFSLAEWLETFSLERARRSIQALLKLVPETALLKISDREFTEVPVTQVLVGQLIHIKSGARIPLDGIIHQGKSDINQAPITGESLPVAVQEGDRVLAGTINGDGSLIVSVTQGYQNTKIAQIIKLINESQKQKAPTQKFVDVFAKYYTPIVFIFALTAIVIPPLFFNGSWSIWLYRSLVLLVIACPCALVIATPVSIVAGLTAMTRRGVLIKGGAGLEALGKLRSLAVDKTGTITVGAPQVLQIHAMNGYKDNDLLAIAASIDHHSTHPLAKAVVSEAEKRQLTVATSVDYRSISGRGAEAVIDDHTYFVGNHRYVHDYAICSNELEQKLQSIEEQSQSVVVVGHRPHHGCKGIIMGVLGLGDAIRKEAVDAISLLHKVGVQSVVMLSGDNQRTVDVISKAVGIDEAYGNLLPDEKVLKIKEIKNRFQTVAMIGDGVNDAPAMATATLGIAMGGSGTDTAIETSDITLMQDNLMGVVDAIQIGKKTIRIIWFNTGFALATKLLFLILSISGYSSLWLAIAADTGATLLVIANSLRLLK